MARLGLILGDQLNANHAVLDELDPATDSLLMGEVADEASYVPHHIKKIVLIFSAMRHRAQDLKNAGWNLHYHLFDPHGEIKSFSDLLDAQLERAPFDALLVAQPGEWRVLNQLQIWAESHNVALKVLPDRRFIDDLSVFNGWAEGKKQLRMEFFYRLMRQKTGYLMIDGEPVGGVWNLDADNRKPWKGDPPVVPIKGSTPDAITQSVMDELRDAWPTFGDIDGFDYPVTANEAMQALDEFIAHRLVAFGDFQDALVDGEDYLFHSRISSAMNIGLLDPMVVCEKVIAAHSKGMAPLNAVEGFVRQIIGWREFIRGIYWRFMPEYAERNSLGHDQALPDWYWTGKTQMRCLAQAIDATKRNAYAHHIQRLMVTGNFALLLGVIPEAICRWYLAVYIDAYEWVELPNTLGMVMHADGGVVGSKPYAASGKYIQRMGDHCKHCVFNVKETVGEKACPFNALYWDFLIRHRAQFESNPRMRMMYRNVDRMAAEQQTGIEHRAQWIKDHINEL